MTSYTEQEARGKACHRTLCADIWSNPKENEGEAKTAWTPCIASDCMAWRWAMERLPHGDTAVAYRRTKLSEGHYDNEPLGYCGLVEKAQP